MVKSLSLLQLEQILNPKFYFTNLLKFWLFVLCVFVHVVPGMGNTSPKDMDSLLPLMNMVIYSIDKVKKLRLNREVKGILWCHIQMITHSPFWSLKWELKVQPWVHFLLTVY